VNKYICVKRQMKKKKGKPPPVCTTVASLVISAAVVGTGEMTLGRGWLFGGGRVSAPGEVEMVQCRQPQSIKVSGIWLTE